MNKEHDFIGEVLAEDKEARRPRTLSEMKPVERLAHARGEPVPPVTVINGLTAEVARLAEEVQALTHWRGLALQFDNHRMATLYHLKALLDSSEHAVVARAFLAAPPLAAHEVVAQRDDFKKQAEGWKNNAERYLGAEAEGLEEIGRLKQLVWDIEKRLDADESYPSLGYDLEKRMAGVLND